MTNAAPPIIRSIVCCDDPKRERLPAASFEWGYLATHTEVLNSLLTHYMLSSLTIYEQSRRVCSVYLVIENDMP